MSESTIQLGTVKYARKSGVIARKLGFGEGWPDYMFLSKGRTLFIEFKRPGEKPTPIQNHMHELLRLAGFVVIVIDDIEAGVTAIDQFKENT